MQTPGQAYFLRMVENLRTNEEVMLYANILETTPDEHAAVTEFLRLEYEREAISYPGTPPGYDPDAAIWAARTLYISSQLLLYRENKIKDLPDLLPDHLEPSASAILSADLTLRFLPDLVSHLEMIDPDDELLELLRTILQKWHYSAVNYLKDFQTFDFSIVQSNACLYQLYCDRIIQHKKLTTAVHPVFKEKISAHLGIYGDHFWKEFINHNITNIS
jgi:hypothetical protein